MYFLVDDIYFDEYNFEIMGIDEFTGYEYIWDLSKLNLINFYDDRFFIDKDLIIEFIENHYLSEYDDSDEPSFIKTDEEYYEVYDPSKVKIANNPNYRQYIRNLVENIKFIGESSKIPFPQSDDLNRFICIGQLF
ncbi:hypothetical protein [Methanobrevibacter sp.]|uniref:hypothetical protein n=1 Tax=Methanobrevibacter sp. TaxID=66852 RepID=UPI00397671E7